MEVHLLNGDALAEKFPVLGEVVICREAMIDGPCAATDDDALWKQRADFILSQYPSTQDAYRHLVVEEFEKLKRTSLKIVNFWFEHDLFCQANLWFSVDFVCRHLPAAELYFAMPDPTSDLKWYGFGNMNEADLENVYKNRIYVNNRDKQLALSLWDAYRNNDREKLAALSLTPSECFPKLSEVCQAHLDRTNEAGLGRPQQKLRSIINTGETEFENIFRAFQKTEGVFGFGDLQVKKLLREVTQ